MRPSRRQIEARKRTWKTGVTDELPRLLDEADARIALEATALISAAMLQRLG